MTNDYSNLVVAWVAVGGRGRLKGAVFGALLVNLLYNYLTSLAPDFWPFVLGGLYIGAAIFFTAGMISLRGAIFLAWLLAAPPVWKATLDHYTGAHLAAPIFYTHWAVWIALGVYLYWLLLRRRPHQSPLEGGRAMAVGFDRPARGAGPLSLRGPGWNVRRDGFHPPAARTGGAGRGK